MIDGRITITTGGFVAMPPDNRPLAHRVKALANRFDAMAIGARKQAALSRQIAENHERDAKTLHDAAAALEGK